MKLSFTAPVPAEPASLQLSFNVAAAEQVCALPTTAAARAARPLKIHQKRKSDLKNESK
ncbi:hypothetical protein [Methanimicrococcus hongohii]|uniref:hypothetical protein n=1 Tax=Methanimicrococcus hongohii TaxID=3028295 RepID=UPI00292F1D5D|nr:hypothetical protein [Methanimicrococcus sp. Hf6]